MTINWTLTWKNKWSAPSWYYFWIQHIIYLVFLFYQAKKKKNNWDLKLLFQGSCDQEAATNTKRKNKQLKENVKL